MGVRPYGAYVFSYIRVLFPFHAAAWNATFEPIQRMLDEPNHAKRDELTAKWRDNAGTQLNTIVVTSALFAGVITAAYSWPVLARLDITSQTTVMAIWYSALVFSLASIATSAQQSVALTRLGSHPEGLKKTRELLGNNLGAGWEPNKLQLFIWQTPLSMLNTSVVMFMIGLVVLVWQSVSPAWTGNDIKVVTIFTLTLVYVSCLYLMSNYGIYYRIRRP
ncbi:hypothetical protein BS50DRAFT_678595 [Corynespora cassiicola Philippines]|uniref:Uncharacterized protein n=1 Tax=Corynespora cassiicola Philippines TaxID=1448308 RepID=A0A2T2NGD5_CORCC|nr:hypothetical protein BS50DRAFT_678595 [Corynespora cassiicola Philippines]